MFNEENEFEYEENQMDEIRLQELYEKSLENSMRLAYSTIEDLGMEDWLQSIPMSKERKIKILSNMIHWYEIREEYEKCAILLEGKQTLI